MPRDPRLGAPASVLLGWMAALLAMPLALLAAAAGQGVGAMAGGCQWIGISLPVGRPVWALVNQPTVDFASRSAALGYWLGSLLLPLGLAAAILMTGVRPRSLAGTLTAVELAWGFTLGAAWLALLDPGDGHLARWLKLRDLPQAMVWTAPALAATAGVPIALRLLSAARAVRPHLGRWRRLGLVAVYLLVPALSWLLVGSAAVGRGSLRAAIAVLPAAASALVVAYFFYPPAAARPLRSRRARGLVWMLAVAVPVGALQWVAGRPLGGQRWTGVLWGSPNALNNIRPWVAARPLPWIGTDGAAGRLGNTEKAGDASPVPEGGARPAIRPTKPDDGLPRAPASGDRKDGEP